MDSSNVAIVNITGDKIHHDVVIVNILYDHNAMTHRTADRGGRSARRAARTRRRGPYHHADLRRALLDKGLELLTRDGLAAFSLRALAQELGVSHAAPYRHFASREELLAEIVRDSAARFHQALMSSLVVEGDDKENLYRLGEAYVLFYLDNPAIFALFSVLPGMLAADDAGLGRLFTSPVAAPCPGDKDLMQDEGFLTLRRAASAFLGRYAGLNERDVLLGFWAKAHGLAALLVSRPDYFAPEDLKSGLARVIRRMF
jgi:AcrR family transcriptional regulator